MTQSDQELREAAERLRKRYAVPVGGPCPVCTTERKIAAGDGGVVIYACPATGPDHEHYRRSRIEVAAGDADVVLVASRILSLLDEVERGRASCTDSGGSPAQEPAKSDGLRDLAPLRIRKWDTTWNGGVEIALTRPIEEADRERLKRAVWAFSRTLAGGGGWRPIESAPRDGTRLLLWGPFWSSAVTGWTFGDDAWQDCRKDSHINPPTHWQPLPEPPEGAE